MIARELLGTASIPNDGGELKLYSRTLKGGNEYSIMLGRIELMNSRLSYSEEALATLTNERILPRPEPHILIGGLGMGFTLRTALSEMPVDAKISVAELVPAVVDWARGPMASLHEGSLDDPRADIQIRDVSHIIKNSPATYDAILLDVDNGPDGLTHDSNEAIYSAAGLRAAHGALKTDGILAIWSCAPDDAFARRLGKSRFDVEEIKVRARGDRGAHHVIWLARKR